MRTIRIFVSSTFRDMNAERDHINGIVLPELKSRCLRRGVELVGIDLRWGITDAEARARGTLEICLDEIQRSTFFLCLLGDRLGYVPVPEQIPATRYRRARQSPALSPSDATLLDTWYGPDDTARARPYVLRSDRQPGVRVERRLIAIWEAVGLPRAGDSMTAREIFDGALDAKRGVKGAFFYLRSTGPQHHSDFPESFLPVFAEQDPGNIDKLAALRREVHRRSNTSVLVREYEADYAGLRIDPGLLPAALSDADRRAMGDGVVAADEWTHLSPATRVAFDAHGTVAETGMDALGQRILADLWAAIEAELEARPEPSAPDDRAAADHERFLNDRTQVFVGRGGQLGHLLARVADGVDGEPFVVTGEPGCGKSALMAELAVRRCCDRFPGALVLPYFVGAAPDSVDVTATVRYLCSALQRGCDLDVELPMDPDRLRYALPALLERAAAVRPVIVILDALDELDPANDSHALRWLPLRVPAGAALVVSTLAGDCLDRFREHVRPDDIVKVGVLPRADRASVVTRQLTRRGKQLTRGQLRALLDTRRRPEAALPLYLMVALEELALVGGRDVLDERLERLPPTLEGLFDAVLQRLEWEHTRVLCESVLDWLAASRSGLRELEVVELLGPTVPPIRWTRLYRSLEFYLRPADEQTGSGLIDFHHNQLRAAVDRRYLGARSASAASARRRGVHGELAGYFRRVASDGRDPTRWHSRRPRGLSELPYHLLHAGRRDDVRALLLEFDWLRARLASSDVVAVLGDYEYVGDDGGLRRVQWSLRLAAHVLQVDGAQLPSQLVGRLGEDPDAGVRRILGAARRWRGAPWFRPLRSSLANPTDALRRTLSGHEDAVFDFAVTPDSQLLVSASRDRTLKVWELSTGRVIHTLFGHTDMVWKVEVTPDGRRAISASKDRTAKVWDLVSGTLVHTLTGHDDEVVGLAIAPNGSVVTGSLSAFLRRPYGMTCKIWSPATGREVASLFRGSADGLYLESILPTRQRLHLVLQAWDGTVSISDLMADRVVATLAGEQAHVSCAALTPDGRAIALGSTEGAIDLFDVATGERARRIEGHSSNVSSLATASNGLELISGSGDRTVRVWDLATGQPTAVLSGHSGTISSAQRTPDGRSVVSSSYDSSLKVWELSEEPPLTSRRRDPSVGHQRDVRGLVFLPGGDQLVSCSDDGTVGVWSGRTGRLLRTSVAHDDSIFSIATARTRRLVLTGSNDGTIKMWDTSAWPWKLRGTLDGVWGSIASIAVTPDERFALGGSWDHAVGIWDLQSGMRARSLRKHESQVNSVAVTPDGRRIVSGSDDRRILVRSWNGTTVATLVGHETYVNAVAVTPDGHHVVSGSADRTVRVWDLEGGRAIRVLRGHASAVNCVAVTPSGRFVVSGSDDMSLKAFEIGTGQCVATFTAQGEVRACAVAGELDRVGAGTADGRVHVLQLVGQAVPPATSSAGA